MAHGYSAKTVPIAFRLPIKVYELLEKRVKGKRSRHTTVNQYVKDRIIYDTLRKR